MNKEKTVFLFLFFLKVGEVKVEVVLRCRRETEVLEGK